MQAKHLIIIAIVGIVALLAFNMLNGSRHNNTPVEASAVTTDPSDSTTTSNSNDSISSKPLAEQPKAMVDKASDSIEQAQQAETDKMAQVEAESAQ